MRKKSFLKFLVGLGPGTLVVIVAVLQSWSPADQLHHVRAKDQLHQQELEQRRLRPPAEPS